MHTRQPGVAGTHCTQCGCFESKRRSGTRGSWTRRVMREAERVEGDAMTRRVSWLVTVAFLLMAVRATGDSAVATKVRVTGTFSDMYYNTEGGDLLGTEVRIVRGKSGYQATVQVAQGSPADVVVVNVWTSGDSVRFVLPDSERFVGRVTSKFLRGQFLKTGGPPQVVKLARGRSYWD